MNLRSKIAMAMVAFAVPALSFASTSLDLTIEGGTVQMNTGSGYTDGNGHSGNVKIELNYQVSGDLYEFSYGYAPFELAANIFAHDSNDAYGLGRNHELAFSFSNPGDDNVHEALAGQWFQADTGTITKVFDLGEKTLHDIWAKSDIKQTGQTSTLTLFATIDGLEDAKWFADGHGDFLGNISAPEADGSTIVVSEWSDSGASGSGDVAAVPGPGSLGLFGLALLGIPALIAIRRRKHGVY